MEKKEEENGILLSFTNEMVSQNLGLSGTLLAIQKFIVDHSQKMRYPYETKDILESRFTPAEEAFRKGMRSCGAMTNIAAYILRKLGYEVKLVHGSIPKSRNHAWLEIKERDAWNEYDLTNKGCYPREDRVIKNVCDNWEEIRDVIEREHEVYIHRDE